MTSVFSRSSAAPFCWASPLTIGLLVAPIVTGLIGTILPAFGYLPSMGGVAFNLQSWRGLLELPGLGTSVRLSLTTGLMTTALSLSLVALFCAAWHGTRLFALIERILAPVLAVPHVAVAFGIAFLIAPSGWILRALSPWATGFTQPPDWLILQDRHGLSLALGLVAKEVPFLFFVTLAALGQVDGERRRVIARTLGYRPMNGWLKAVFPSVYPQIRLPVLAVLAYGISVVDVAIVLGPTTPAPLAVRLVQMFYDPDLSQRFVASAGAILQLGIVAIGFAIWMALEWTARRVGKYWTDSGQRGRRDDVTRWAAAAALMVSCATVLLGLLVAIVWSFARSWRFPDVWPTELTMVNWTRHFPSLAEPLGNTLTVALSTAGLALLLAIGALEHEARSRRRTSVNFSGLLYLPLVIPQVAFLFGAQIFLIRAHLDGRWIALTWLHLVFVFPYAFLSLSEAYRAWDERYSRTALCLGASATRVFLRIKMPMLLRPAANAAAVGFAVSVGLYLPTLFAGSGRYPTLTTEALAISAGGDSRLLALYALFQTTLPLLAFGLAVAAPASWFRNRQGMHANR